jgi:hypothetical protein
LTLLPAPQLQGGPIFAYAGWFAAAQDGGASVLEDAEDQ